MVDVDKFRPAAESDLERGAKVWVSPHSVDDHGPAQVISRYHDKATVHIRFTDTYSANGRTFEKGQLAEVPVGVLYIPES